MINKNKKLSYSDIISKFPKDRILSTLKQYMTLKSTFGEDLQKTPKTYICESLVSILKQKTNV